MTVLEWDRPEERTYESGLDRGVLYLPDSSAVPWNGLTEVSEKSSREVQSVYFEGRKINELVSNGGYVGTLKAITYPDEFIAVEGIAEVSIGLHFADQQPQVFGLSWRNRVGNGLTEEAGHKIHVLYNVTAVPTDKTHATTTEDPEVASFEWDITAIPEEVDGFRPTAHIIIDTRYIDPAQLVDIEEILYGSESAEASLIPLVDFTQFLYFGYQWKIINNGDGTWKAITPIEGLIEIDGVDPDKWTLNDVNGAYLSADVYQISDSLS